MSAPLSCPVCGSPVPLEVRFCPVCRQPRTHVEEQLRQAASLTGQDYDELLERARKEDAARPPVSPTIAPIPRVTSSLPSAAVSADGGGGKSGKGRRLLGLGCATVLAGFVGILILGALLSAVDSPSDGGTTRGELALLDDKPAQSARDAATPTPKPRATLTPRPRATSTPRPRATSTPRPTATADTTATATYLLEVMFILSDYADVAGDFSTLIGEANFFSSAWLADLKSKSDDMRKLRDDFRKLSPPSEYRAFHRRADQAFTKAVEGGQLFYEGARDLDVTKIERATELVIEAAELMDEANDLIPSSS